MDPSLEALWKNVLDHWDEDAAHAAFLEHCRNTKKLAEAASRYRGMSFDRTRGETAHKRLQAVAVLAMAELESIRSPPREPRGRAASLSLLVFFLAATIALVVYLYIAR